MFVASLFIPRWGKERILLGSILLLTFPLVVAAAEIGGWRAITARFDL